jgi:hypothetical protein
MNQGPRCVVLMKKNGGEKSHATVPLNISSVPDDTDMLIPGRIIPTWSCVVNISSVSDDIDMLPPRRVIPTWSCVVNISSVSNDIDMLPPRRVIPTWSCVVNISPVSDDIDMLPPRRVTPTWSCVVNVVLYISETTGGRGAGAGGRIPLFLPLRSKIQLSERKNFISNIIEV